MFTCLKKKKKKKSNFEKLKKTRTQLDFLGLFFLVSVFSFNILSDKSTWVFNTHKNPKKRGFAASAALAYRELKKKKCCPLVLSCLVALFAIATYHQRYS